LDHAGLEAQQKAHVEARADSSASTSDVGLAGIPPNCQTVLWIDFEAAPDADEALLLPELKKVFDNLFNKEAAHFISFDGKIVPGSPPTFRLAVYFDANFWTTLTTPNAYLESLLCMSADVELTGSLADLINTKTTRPLLVRGGNANMEFDREILSNKALESMPEGVRNAFDGILGALPSEVAEKVKVGGDTMPLNALNLVTNINADARTTLHLEKVRDLVTSAAAAAGVVVPRAVQPMLLGVKSVHLRAQGSAVINIELGDTVPVLQLLPVAEDPPAFEDDTTVDTDHGALGNAAASGDLAEVTRLLGTGVGVEAQDAIGRSALHRAGLCGHLSVVQQLLSVNASLNSVDADGCTALMASAKEGNADVVKALMGAGADVFTKDDTGATAADMATEEGHTAIATMLAASADKPAPAGDRQLKVNFSTNIDQEGKPSAQAMRINITTPSDSTPSISLQERAAELNLNQVPEGCKSMVVADFLASPELTASAEGELQGMIEMIIDGALAANELFLSFEAGLRDAEEGKVYRLAMYFNEDWFKKAVEAQPPVKTLRQLEGSLEMTTPLLELLERQEAGVEDPALPQHLRNFRVRLGLDESILTSEMLAQLPKKENWNMDKIMEKLDTEMVPLQHAEAELNIDFDGPRLITIMEDKLGMATVSALREMATQAPVELPPEFKRMVKGLLRADAVAEGGAVVTMDLGGPLPVFQLLACTAEGEDGGAAQEDDWGDDDDDDGW